MALSTDKHPLNSASAMAVPLSHCKNIFYLWLPRLPSILPGKGETQETAKNRLITELRVKVERRLSVDLFPTDYLFYDQFKGEMIGILKTNKSKKEISEVFRDALELEIYGTVEIHTTYKINIQVKDEEEYLEALPGSNIFRLQRAVIEASYVEDIFDAFKKRKLTNPSVYKAFDIAFRTVIKEHGACVSTPSTVTEQYINEDRLKESIRSSLGSEVKRSKEQKLGGSQKGVVHDSSNGVIDDYEFNEKIADLAIDLANQCVLLLLHIIDDFYKETMHCDNFIFATKSPEQVRREMPFSLIRVFLEGITDLFSVKEILQLSDLDHLVFDRYSDPFAEDSKLTKELQRAILIKVINTTDGKTFRDFLDRFYALKVTGKLNITESEIRNIKALHDLYHNNKVQKMNTSDTGPSQRRASFFEELFVSAVFDKRYILEGTKREDEGVQNEFKRRHFLVRNWIRKLHNIGEKEKNDPSLEELLSATKPNFTWRFRGEAQQFFRPTLGGGIEDLGWHYENPADLLDEEVLEKVESHAKLPQYFATEFRAILDNRTLEGAKFFHNQQYRPWFNAAIALIKCDLNFGFTEKLVTLAKCDPLSYLSLCLSGQWLDYDHLEQIACEVFGRLQPSEVRGAPRVSISESEFRSSLELMANLTTSSIQPMGFSSTQFVTLTSLSTYLKQSFVRFLSSIQEDPSLLRKYGGWLAKFQVPYFETLLKEYYLNGHQILHGLLRESQRLSKLEAKEDKEKREIECFQQAVGGMVHWLYESCPTTLDYIRKRIMHQNDVKAYPGHLALLDESILEHVAFLWRAKISVLAGLSLKECPIKRSEGLGGHLLGFEILIPFTQNIRGYAAKLATNKAFEILSGRISWLTVFLIDHSNVFTENRSLRDNGGCLDELEHIYYQKFYRAFFNGLISKLRATPNDLEDFPFDFPGDEDGSSLKEWGESERVDKDIKMKSCQNKEDERKPERLFFELAFVQSLLDNNIQVSASECLLRRLTNTSSSSSSPSATKSEPSSSDSALVITPGGCDFEPEELIEKIVASFNEHLQKLKATGAEKWRTAVKFDDSLKKMSPPSPSLVHYGSESDPLISQQLLQWFRGGSASTSFLPAFTTASSGDAASSLSSHVSSSISAPSQSRGDASTSAAAASTLSDPNNLTVNTPTHTIITTIRNSSSSASSGSTTSSSSSSLSAFAPSFNPQNPGGR